jgi:adenylate kinase family enzyme
MRFAVLGNSGSGKTTLARRLAGDGDVPMLDLDTVAWEPGKIAVARPVELAIADVQAFCRAQPASFAYAPTLVFLDRA